ncbi:MAG: sugar ABC transporter substrate-binding protein [Mesorhizobium sp.]|uniref:sugar ABC transporter substrate-binding protein n=1 Tax=Mesorhizobium sp. TaxID=1871066 RepID=UPI0011FF224C|nr:sugar ABC transporter substrate-binding protein [Mesorhizobium sp.]TIN95532.1 MAG: sugar ABC transporter substrate-binding protein [Mesorhizobium sp.]TJU97179.1 MAG: sugar ABC transporter substrate-binding protein [Mesorhizobium sp.]
MDQNRILSSSLGRRELLKIAAASMLLATTAGRSASAAVPPKVVGFAHPDRTAAYFRGLQDAIVTQAKEYGYEIRQTSSGFEPQKQILELEAWLAAGIDAMVVAAVDRNSMGPVVQKAKSQGVLFVSYGISVDGADGHVGFDDVDGGTLLGRQVAEFIRQKHSGKAEVGCLTFVSNEVTTARISSVKAALLKELPQTPVYEAEAVIASQGLEAVQSMLVAHPDLQIIVSCTDDAALGARSAFMSRGVAPEGAFIAGFDGANQNLHLIRDRDRYIKASMALDIAEIGRNVVKVPHAFFEDRNPPAAATHLYTPYVPVTQDTEMQVIERLLKVYG